MFKNLRIIKNGTASVYVDGKKVELKSLENTVVQNASYWGGYTDSLCFIIETPEEKRFIDCGGLEDFEETEVDYNLYSVLKKSAGNGFLKATNHNLETGKITISCKILC